jgi:hypothetical protein
MARYFRSKTLGGAVALVALLVMVLSCAETNIGVEPSDNDPPEMAAVRDTTVALGDTLGIFVSAIDPDGDDITYRLTVVVTFEELQQGYRADASLNAQTGYFWFRPGEDDVPSRGFRFTAEDGNGGEDTEGMTVNVTSFF